MKKITRSIEETENAEERTLMEGDFNGRIEERAAKNCEEERENGRGKFNDKRLKEQKKENVQKALNGNKKWDEEQE